MPKNSKQKIVDALHSLMKKKSADKISIREIVSEAGVTRQAFYYHFEDIFHLLEWGA